MGGLEIFYDSLWGIATDLNGLGPFIFIGIALGIFGFLYVCGALIIAAMFGNVTKSFKQITKDGKLKEVYTLIISFALMVLGALFMIWVSNIGIRVTYNIIYYFYII